MIKIHRTIVLFCMATRRDIFQHSLSMMIKLISDKNNKRHTVMNIEPKYNFDVGLMSAMHEGWYQSSGHLYHDFHISPDDVVVDVGCGDAGNLMFCAKQGASIIAADINAEKVNAAVARIKETAARCVRGVAGNSNPLLIDSMTASKVICTEVIEHVDDPAQFLSELVRIGQSGAQYLLTVPDAVGEYIQKNSGAAPSYFEHPNHIRIIERDEFAHMVQAAGLTIERHDFYGAYWTVWMSFFWLCGVDLFQPKDELLLSWAQTWHLLLEQPNSAAVLHQLNQVMPKSQIIVARKA